MIRRLSYKRKENRKRKYGAGRHFKLNLKDRFVMLLVYYRLYITYALTGFLFDLDQSNICKYSKDRGTGERMYTNSTEGIPNNKEAKNSRGS